MLENIDDLAQISSISIDVTLKPKWNKIIHIIFY